MSDEETTAPQECMACRGTGQVISNLGGERRKVTCPWCRGSGTRIPGADAQEYRRTLTGTGTPTGTPHGGAQAGEQDEPSGVGDGGGSGEGGPVGGGGEAA